MMSSMKRPILFNGPMVRAILDGRKTETRRVVEPQPDPVCTDIAQWPSQRGSAWWSPGYLNADAEWDFLPDIRCPYAPGDLLWVREAFNPHYFGMRSAAYRADWNGTAADVTTEPRWTPSIHMPRWASRITLRVEEVRIERLQGIGEGGAQREGVDADLRRESRRAAFARLWDAINAGRGYSWASDPWVWVVRFSRVTP